MSKEKYGAITNLSPSQVYVDKHPFKRNPETNEVMVKEKIFVGDEVIFTYDPRDRNLIHIRHKPKAPKDIEADGEQRKALEQKVHMDKDEAAVSCVGGISPGATGFKIDKSDVYMHRERETPIQPRMWIPDDEKNNFILMQSVLARSVDIVNAFLVAEVARGEKKEDTLTLRCNLIRGVSDELFEYVKKKVESERTNKEVKQP